MSDPSQSSVAEVAQYLTKWADAFGKEGFGGTQYLRRAVYFLSEYDRLKKENNDLPIVHAPVQLELPF